MREAIDGDDERARALQRAARAREPRQGGHALRRNGCVGRNAVVGLAIPGRQVERLDLRRGEAQRVDEALRAHAVARDENQRGGALLTGARETAREFGDDEGVEPFGRAAQRNGAALSEAADGRGERFHFRRLP